MKAPKKTNLFRLIADECGVSPATVTLALQDSSRIGSGTKRKIYFAARRIGYRESKMPGDRHLNFVLINGLRRKEHPFPHPGNLALWYGITRLVGQLDGTINEYDMMLQNGEWQFDSLPSIIRRDKVDGLILTGSAGSEFFDFLREAALPTVAVTAGPTPGLIDQIYYDYERAAREMIEKLVSRNRKRIVFLSRTLDFEINQLFFRGYKSAMEAHGLYDDKLIITRSDLSEFGPDVYHSIFRGRPCPDAVFATDSRDAHQVALAAALAGIPVSKGPEIVMIKLDENRDLFYPTHIIVPDAFELGTVAINRLLHRKKNPSALPVALFLSCKLCLDEAGRS